MEVAYDSNPYQAKRYQYTEDGTTHHAITVLEAELKTIAKPRTTEQVKRRDCLLQCLFSLKYNKKINE